MSKIIIFGAGGKAGRLTTSEAARRGHDVTAVARDVSTLPPFPDGVKTATGDATDSRSVQELAKGADAFIVAIGGADNTVWYRAAQTLLETLQSTPGKIPRILHMGGGASLLAPDGTRFLDSPTFPAEFRGAASGQAEALDCYRSQASGRVSWTYLSPPPVNFAPGRRTGMYRTGLDHPVQDDRGRASVSYEDLAVAMVDEVEQRKFINKRFTIGY